MIQGFWRRSAFVYLHGGRYVSLTCAVERDAGEEVDHVLLCDGIQRA